MNSGKTAPTTLRTKLIADKADEASERANDPVSTSATDQSATRLTQRIGVAEVIERRQVGAEHADVQDHDADARAHPVDRLVRREAEDERPDGYAHASANCTSQRVVSTGRVQRDCWSVLRTSGVEAGFRAALVDVGAVQSGAVLVVGWFIASLASWQVLQQAREARIAGPTHADTGAEELRDVDETGFARVEVEDSTVHIRDRDEEEVWEGRGGSAPRRDSRRSSCRRLTEDGPGERDPERDGEEHGFGEQHADWPAQRSLEHFGQGAALDVAFALVPVVAGRLAEFRCLTREQDRASRLVENERHDDGKGARHGEESPRDVVEPLDLREVAECDGPESGCCTRNSTSVSASSLRS